MPWTQTTAPGTFAVSVATLKSQLRNTDPSEDALLELYLNAAINLVETETRKRLIRRTFRLDLPCFPGGCIELPLAPLVSVESVKYYTGGTLTTWDGSYYTTDTTSLLGRIVPKNGYPFPSVDLDLPNAVQVEFTAGYGDTEEDVPADLRMLVIFLATHFFINRVPVANVTMSQVPLTFHYALSLAKIWSA